MVVPEQGQITTASIGADPDADFAPTFFASSKITPSCSAMASGVVSHSCWSVSLPESVTTRRTVFPALSNVSTRRSP